MLWSLKHFHIKAKIIIKNNYSIILFIENYFFKSLKNFDLRPLIFLYLIFIIKNLIIGLKTFLIFLLIFTKSPKIKFYLFLLNYRKLQLFSPIYFLMLRFLNMYNIHHLYSFSTHNLTFL